MVGAAELVAADEQGDLLAREEHGAADVAREHRRRVLWKSSDAAGVAAAAEQLVTLESPPLPSTVVLEPPSGALDA